MNEDAERICQWLLTLDPMLSHFSSFDDDYNYDIEYKYSKI